MPETTPRVLFVCTHDAACRQMSEVLGLRSLTAACDARHQKGECPWSSVKTPLKHIVPRLEDTRSPGVHARRLCWRSSWSSTAVACDDGTKVAALQDYVTWCLTDGQECSESLGFVHLPPRVVSRAVRAVGSIP